MKKFIIPAAVIVFFMLGASNAVACSCLMDNVQSTGKKVSLAYKQAAAVFYGEAIEVRRKSSENQSIDDENEPLTVIFKVERSWKGKVLREVVVLTAGNSAMCGFNFEAGRKYLVYAGSDGKDLQTTICTRTAAGNADARYLNKIKKPRLFAKNKK